MVANHALSGWRAQLRALALLTLVALAVVWRLVALGEIPYDLPRQESLRPWRAPYAQRAPADTGDPMAPYRAYWRSYLAGDQVLTVWPDHLAVREQVRAGHAPLWQPRALGGVPLLVTTAESPLSPLTWPSYLLPLVRGRGVTLLLHLVLAGYGMFLLLSRRGRSEAAALGGAAVFMLNPLFVAWLPFGDTVPVFGLVPFGLLAVERLTTHASAPAAALLALVTGVELLGGNPQQGALAVMLQGAWALAIPLPAEGSRSRAEILGWAALGTTLGVALAAVQLLPFAEMLSLSARPPDRYRDTNYLPLSSLWTLVFPRLFGHPAHGDYLGASLFSRPFFSVLGPGPGALAVGLAALGAAHRRSRVAIAAVAVVFGGLALLAIPALRSAAGALPLFNTTDALRGLGVGYLALAALASSGIDAVTAPRAPALAARWLGLVAALAVVLEITTRLGGGPLAQALHTALRPAALLSPRVLVPVALAALLAASARLALRHASAARWLVAAVAALELVALARPSLPSAPPHRVLRETPAIAALRQRFARYGALRMTGVTEPGTFPPYDGDHLPPNTAAAMGFDDLRACSRLPPSPMVEIYNAIAPVSFPTLAPGDVDRPLFDLLDLGYVLSDHPLEPSHFREVAPGLWANRRPRMRAFFTRCARVITDPAERVRAITDRAFEPFAAAVLSRPLPGVRTCDRDPSPRPAQVRYPAPGRVEIEVDASGDGVLVLADAWFPGWEAEVDGAAQEVLLVDHALRGVALGPGRHTVRMRFRPASVRDGAALSALALLGLIALALGRPRRVSEDLWVGAWAFAALALFAGNAPMPNDNDALYADVIRSLREGGSWLRLAIHGVPFLDKPPLFFGLGALVTRVFGDGEFSLRLVSIASGAGCAVLAARMARRISGVREAGVLAAALVVTAPLFFEYSRRVYMEVPLAFAVLWSLDLTLRGRWAAAGAVAGLGFMLKTIPGGLGLAAGIIAYAVTERRVPLRETLVAAGAFAAVVVPWHVAAWLAQPEAFLDFTLRLHVRDQVMSAQPWSRGGPLFYPMTLLRHDPLILAACVATLAAGFARRKRDPELAAVAIAVALQVALYTAISTKKDLYFLTAYPVAAVGAGALLGPWASGRPPRVALLLTLGALQLLSIAGEHVYPDPRASASGWIEPLARRFAAAAPPGAVLTLRDTYFAAPQYYAGRPARYAVADPAAAALIRRIPYLRYGDLVRVWDDALLDHGGWAIVKADDGEALLARRPDVTVVARNLAYWLVRGPR
jgi:4-amino-4-deoxy-L-arabinose transferase-like glycosyltransferase